MIQNFEEVRRQLKELSEVINSFKSESVQLKIIELIFGAGMQPQPDETETTREDESAHRKRRKRTPRPDAERTVEKKSGRKPRATSGQGAVATLRAVYEKGFFKEPRTIRSILLHCETDLARKIKANEISGTLGRMVRNDELKRTKNKDGQYEYFKS